MQYHAQASPMQGEKVLADMEDKGQNPLNSLVGSKVFTSFQSEGDVFIAYILASTSYTNVTLYVTAVYVDVQLCTKYIYKSC